MDGVNAVGTTQFDIVFAPQSAAGGYMLTIGPDIRDLAGNQMDQDQNGVNGEVPDDQFTGGFTILSPTPILTLKVNGEHPDPPVVTTPGPVKLTLSLSPSSFTGTLDWYWVIVFNGQVFWVTGGGLSPTPAPLFSSPPIVLADVTLFDLTFPSGTTVTNGFFLVDGATVVASDVITAMVAATPTQ